MWADAAAALTPAAVHTVVARLRRQLGDEVVITSDAGYLLPSTVSLDADRFTELAVAVHEHGADEDWPTRAARCREALALWAGPTAYDGVRDELVRPERVRLDELHRRVRADLAEYLLSPTTTTADVSEALLLAQTLLEANPLDESAAVLAMRALYRLHRQGEALELFEELRLRLRDELGVGPGAAAVDTHARVLAQDGELEGRPAPVVHPGRRLPVPTSPTIGRQAELGTVIDAWRDGHRLITVVGPGGVGKSRLVADLGAALQPDHDVVHVTLSSHAGLDAQDLAAGLAVTTGVPLAEEDAVAGLVRALRTADLTVLVDEAEWVIGAAAEVARAVLADCPGVRLVVASRLPLEAVGERLITLAPLAVPPVGADPVLIRASPAVQLLVERLTDRGASPSGPVASWGPAELDMLAEVTRRVDGLPLALELVAGRAALVPLTELLDLVARPLELESDEVGRDPRQQSLRRTLSWSLERLDGTAHDALARLSTFVGPFSLPAARGVAGSDGPDVAIAVRTLVAAHLLEIDRSAGGLSFRMLRTVRELARERLEESGLAARVRSRHQQWFAGRWRDAPLSDELIEHVGRTYDDQLEALAGLLDAGDVDAAADVALALCRRWLFVETPGPGLRWTSSLLARTDLTGCQRARIHVARAAFQQRLDWTEGERSWIEAALADDPDWTCQLELLTAITAYVTGDTEAAVAGLERARSVAERGAAHQLPEITATQAVVDAARGHHEAAAALAGEALARVGSSASAVQLLTVLPKVALALLDAGRPGEALGLLTRAAEEASTRFGISPTGTIAANAGWSALAIDEPGLALGWFSRALVGPQAFVIPAAIGEAAVGAAAAAARLGRPGAAELLGQGEWLLAQEGYVLPPSLADHVSATRQRVGEVTPPAAWSADLAATRIVQLVEPDALAPGLTG